MLTRFRTAVLMALLALPALAQAQVTIGTPATSSSSFASDFRRGDGFAGAYGQTFRVPDLLNTRLDTWSFWTSTFFQQQGWAALSLQLHIVEWPGSDCGTHCYNHGVSFSSPLYTSDVRVSTQSEPEELEFNVGLILDPTRTYLAFLKPVSVLTPNADGFQSFFYSCVQLDCGGGQSTYTDGSLIELVTDSYRFDAAAGGYVYDDLTVSARTLEYSTTYDAHFQADFSAPMSAVPEPATLTLMGTGLAGLWAARRRRKSS